MRNNLIYILLIITFCRCGNDKVLSDNNSFNGEITYLIEIETFDTLNIDRHNQLKNRFGDTLLIKFGDLGKYELLHQNSSESGFESINYDNQSGNNIVILKNAQQYSDYVEGNLFTKIDKKKINNDSIMNYDCDCVSYETSSYDNGNVTFNYCYSKSTPYVNYKYFNKYTPLRWICNPAVKKNNPFLRAVQRYSLHTHFIQKT